MHPLPTVRVPAGGLSSAVGLPRLVKTANVGYILALLEDLELRLETSGCEELVEKK